MTKIDHRNIKSELSVGDHIQVDGKGPYRVTFLYWEMEGNEKDHGVDIDDPEDEFLGVICSSDITNGYHEIIKV